MFNQFKQQLSFFYLTDLGTPQLNLYKHNLQAVNVVVGFKLFLSIIILIGFIIFLFKQIKIINNKHISQTLNFVQSYEFNNFFVYICVLMILIFCLSLTKNNTIFMFFFIAQPVLLIPITYLCVFNVNSFLCVNLSQKNKIITTLVSDIISAVSLILKFINQYIRICLITTVFLLIYEFISSTFVLYKTINFNMYIINNVYTSTIRLLFEVIDFYFILMIQFNAYFILLLWLLSFLFILKLNNIFEN